MLSKFALNINLRRYNVAEAGDGGAGGAAGAPGHGRVVQVDPIKPAFKPPGTKRLKLQYGETGFKFLLRIQLAPLQHGGGGGGRARRARRGRRGEDRCRERGGPPRYAGARAPALGRAVQVDLIKPELKAPGTKRFEARI